MASRGKPRALPAPKGQCKACNCQAFEGPDALVKCSFCNHDATEHHVQQVQAQGEPKSFFGKLKAAWNGEDQLPKSAAPVDALPQLPNQAQPWNTQQQGSLPAVPQPWMQQNALPTTPQDPSGMQPWMQQGLPNTAQPWTQQTQFNPTNLPQNPQPTLQPWNQANALPDTPQMWNAQPQQQSQDQQQQPQPWNQRLPMTAQPWAPAEPQQAQAQRNQTQQPDKAGELSDTDLNTSLADFALDRGYDVTQWQALADNLNVELVKDIDWIDADTITSACDSLGSLPQIRSGYLALLAHVKSLLAGPYNPGVLPVLRPSLSSTASPPAALSPSVPTPASQDTGGGVILIDPPSSAPKPLPKPKVLKDQTDATEKASADPAPAQAKKPKPTPKAKPKIEQYTVGDDQAAQAAPQPLQPWQQQPPQQSPPWQQPQQQIPQQPVLPQQTSASQQPWQQQAQQPQQPWQQAQTQQIQQQAQPWQQPQSQAQPQPWQQPQLQSQLQPQLQPTQAQQPPQAQPQAQQPQAQPQLQPQPKPRPTPPPQPQAQQPPQVQPRVQPPQAQPQSQLQAQPHPQPQAQQPQLLQPQAQQPQAQQPQQQQQAQQPQGQTICQAQGCFNVAHPGFSHCSQQHSVSPQKPTNMPAQAVQQSQALPKPQQQPGQAQPQQQQQQQQPQGLFQPQMQVNAAQAQPFAQAQSQQQQPQQQQFQQQQQPPQQQQFQPQQFQPQQFQPQQQMFQQPQQQQQFNQAVPTGQVICQAVGCFNIAHQGFQHCSQQHSMGPQKGAALQAPLMPMAIKLCDAPTGCGNYTAPGQLYCANCMILMQMQPSFGGMQVPTGVGQFGQMAVDPATSCKNLGCTNSRRDDHPYCCRSCAPGGNNYHGDKQAQAASTINIGGFGSIDSSTDPDPGHRRCQNKGCNRPTADPYDYCGKSCSPSGTNHHGLKDASDPGFDQPVTAAIGDGLCSNVGCNKKQKSGFPFCSRDCGVGGKDYKGHKTASPIAQQGICLNKGCIALCWPGHPYCGNRCRPNYPNHRGNKPGAPNVIAVGAVVGPVAPTSLSLVVLDPASAEYIKVAGLFTSTWQAAINQNSNKAPIGTIHMIFAIHTPNVYSKYVAYKKMITTPNETQVFHGTSIKCDLVSSKAFCGSSSCAVCNISATGFDVGMAGTKIAFQRYGKGVYFAPHSSKSHDYTVGLHGTKCRMMFLCDVAKGREHTETGDLTSIKQPPNGCDSVMGVPGGSLNFPELVVYNSEAILPRYIIAYEKQGVGKIAT